MSLKPSWNHESRKFAPGFHSPHSLWRSHREFNFAGRLAIGEGRVSLGRSATTMLSKARAFLDPDHRRRVPFASQCFGLRSVDAHSEIERSFGNWKPVGLFFCSGAPILKIKVERPVRVVGEWHPTADGKAVQAVGDLKAFVVVERNRPKGVRRRGSAFIEVDFVVVCTVKRFARLVAKVKRINRILGQVRAETDLGDN